MVAAGDSARRVHHDRVADLRAFRIQGFLHHQRAVARTTGEHGASVCGLEAERELRLPRADERFSDLHFPP